MKEKHRLEGALAAAVALSLGSGFGSAEAAPELEPVIEAIEQAREQVGSVNAGELQQQQKTKREQDEHGIVSVGGADIQQPDERPELDLPSELKVQVEGFKFSGQNLVPEEELQKVLADKVGKLLAFSDLQDGVDKLTAYFRDKGYVATRVYIPVQKIEGGIIEYAIMVGRFDGITVNNHTRIHDLAVERQIRCLKKGDYLTKKNLERAIWLLSDLAGADAKATLSTGSETGTVHVTIDLQKHKGKQGLFTIDNFGNRYTGYGEYSLSYNFLNPAREGDQLAVGGLVTGRKLFNYGLNYMIPVATDGLVASLGYNYLSYRLGAEYRALDGRGTSRIASAGLDYAIRRSQKNNLYVGLRYENGQFKDEYRRLGLTYSEKHGNAGILSLYGDETDHYGGTNWRIDYELGGIGFDSDMTRWLYQGSGTDGSYQKVTGRILRRQDLNDRLYLLLSARGQYPNHNLDSSEHMSLGGYYGVRAYPQGEASGDMGYITRAELRWLIPLKAQDQQLQFATYFDHGGIKINKSGGFGDNYRHLEGVGIGLSWSRYEDWFLRTDYAWRIGHERVLSDPSHHGGHFWVRGGVYF